MTFPVSLARADFSVLNTSAPPFVSRPSGTGLAACPEPGGVDSKGLQWRGDRWELEPLRPSSDLFALAKTFMACLEGLGSPLSRFASGLFKGIGPVMAEAAPAGTSGPAAKAKPARKTDAIRAIERARIVVPSDTTLQELERTPAMRAMAAGIVDHLRKEFLKAAEEDRDTALLLKDGLENINEVAVMLPELAPHSIAGLRGEIGKAGLLPGEAFASAMPVIGLYEPGMNTVFVGHAFRGMYEAATIIHEFWHVREHFSPEVVKTPEYDPQKLTRCFEILDGVSLTALNCLHEGDLQGVACSNASSFLRPYRNRVLIERCASPVPSTDDGLLESRLTFHEPGGRSLTIGLKFRLEGEGPFCRKIPVSYAPPGLPYRALEPWEAPFADLAVKGNYGKARAKVEATYPPERVHVEYHAHFVDSVPRAVAKQLCPELFTRPADPRKAVPKARPPVDPQPAAQSQSQHSASKDDL